MCFFFSSRRRHTRWNCDWSSDVCSSDLTHPGETEAEGPSDLDFLMAGPGTEYVLTRDAIISYTMDGIVAESVPAQKFLNRWNEAADKREGENDSDSQSQAMAWANRFIDEMDRLNHEEELLNL